MQTRARLYNTYPDAVAVVTELERSDLHPNREISLIARDNAHGRDAASEATRTPDSSATGVGVGTGAVAGGLIGLLTGLGLMAIPGIGPLVAAGWLATTLAGAATGAMAGGMVGALVNAGISHEEAETYEEGVRRGSTFVAVQAEEADLPKVEAIMNSKPSRDWQTLRDEYRRSGWEPKR